MSFLLNAIIGLGALASTAAAHGYVSGIVADGVYTKGWTPDYWYDIVNHVSFPAPPGWYCENLDLGFIPPEQYQDPNIICHKNAVHANVSATVKAGGTVQFQWSAWPHSLGPVLTYVANCNGDCKTIAKTALQWVKIDEYGIDFNSQTWASGMLIANNNSWTTHVPATLAPGQYVFRHEIIALHGASSLNGAQNYPQCLNIQVTGSGTKNPTGVAATTLYKETDPGIYFNPYVTLTNYTIPGPQLWTG